MLDIIGLAFRFLPKLPAVQRGVAAIQSDPDAVDVINKIVPVTQRALNNPDVTAMLAIFRDLFAAIGGGHQALASVLQQHGADPAELQRLMASGNPDANQGGSDNANI